MDSQESADISLSNKYKNFIGNNNKSLIDRYAISYAFWQIEFNNSTNDDPIELIMNNLKYIMEDIKSKFSKNIQNKIFDKVKEICRDTKNDNSTTYQKHQPKINSTKQKDNDHCRCGSNIKYKKCCKKGIPHDQTIGQLYDFVCQSFIDHNINIRDELHTINAIFYEGIKELNLKGIMHMGYKNFQDEDSRYSFYHMWVEVYGIAYDLAHSVSYVLDQKTDQLYYDKHTHEYTISMEKQDTHELKTTTEELEKYTLEFNNYEMDNVEYWKSKNETLNDIRIKTLEYCRKL